MRPWLRDGSILGAAQIAASGIALCTLLLVARGLGEGRFGTFAAVLGLAQAASLVIGMGTETFLLRELSRADVGEPERAELLQSVLALVARATPVAAAVGLLAALAVTRRVELAAGWAVLLVYVGGLGLCSAAEARLRAARRVAAVATSLVTEKTVALGSVLLVVAVAGAGVLGVALALLPGMLVRLVVDCVALHRRGWLPAGLALRVPARSIVRRSAPIALNGLTTVGIPRLDTTLVAAATAGGAGYFALGGSLVGAALVVPSTLSQAMYPHLARGGLRGRRAVALYAVSGLAGAALLVAATPSILALAFPAAEGEATGAVRRMLAAIPIAFVANGLLPLVYARRLEHGTPVPLAAATLLGSVAVVAGAALGGVEGAALGFLLRPLLILAVLAAVLGAPRRHAARREAASAT